MAKKEDEVTEINLRDHKARVTLSDPAAKRKADKLSAMRITLTYIESQNMKASPKKTMKIADEYLEWLEKK